MTKIESRAGYGVRFFRAPFRVSRWRGDAPGKGFTHGFTREGDGVRWRRIRMYQWPFGVIHVLGRWDA